VPQLRLAASGRYVMYSPGPNSNPNVQHELQRWLAVSPNGDAARFSSRMDAIGTFRRTTTPRLGEPLAAREALIRRAQGAHRHPAR
jgi:hypothetical protein